MLQRSSWGDYWHFLIKHLQKRLDLLKKYVVQHKLAIVGEPIYLFYSPPWTLPLFRRNEIMLQLK